MAEEQRTINSISDVIGSAKFNPNGGRVRIATTMIVIGGLIGAIGAAVAGFELARTIQEWLKDFEVAPSELARTKFRQAAVASQAAMDAWLQSNGGASVAAGSKSS